VCVAFIWSNLTLPPRGLPPYRGEVVCAPQWPGELCWREWKLLVGPPTPDWSKGGGQTECSPWSSRLAVGRGVTTPPRKMLLSRNHGGGQDPHRVVAPVKKKNLTLGFQSIFLGPEHFRFRFILVLLCWLFTRITQKCASFHSLCPGLYILVTFISEPDIMLPI
jgi:hypothetical protein